MQLNIEDVRGFAGKHEFDIKPLTILVGENSSGKTSLLATLFSVLQTDFPSADTFNRPPFELGSFDTIATYRGGKYGRASSFSIGWEVASDRFMRVSFMNGDGIPRVDAFELKSGKNVLIGKPGDGEFHLTLSDSEGKTFKLDGNFDSTERFSRFADIPRLILTAVQKLTEQSTEKTAVLNIPLDRLFVLMNDMQAMRPAVTALAPLRSRPRRTYDALIEEFKPEGDHIPLVLARVLKGSGVREKAVARTLAAFGKESGLFTELKVIRKGTRPSDPFQVRVKSAGPDANLVDVGYGVSQALPIVVDSILAGERSLVLVQQPEVHLHPKAQAALGTFFASMIAESHKRFVIETHSDYLVDRVRMAVAKGVIKPAQVNIVFLERVGINVKTHSLELDNLGNIINAPPSYRAFFLEEETRLLFRAS